MEFALFVCFLIVCIFIHSCCCCCRIGRYPTFFICIGCQAVFGTIAAFSPNFATFAAMRFFIGASSLGVYMVAFILGEHELKAKLFLLPPSHSICYHSPSRPTPTASNRRRSPCHAQLPVLVSKVKGCVYHFYYESID